MWRRRVVDVYPTPEEFEKAVDDAINRAGGGLIMPKTIAKRLGVWEVSLRNMLHEEGYGPVVEKIYMSGLLSCLEAPVKKNAKSSESVGVLKKLFGWFKGVRFFS